MAQTWAIVDEEDYQWAIQWKWSINNPHPKRNGKKRYLRTRAGWRDGNAVYLHVGIMRRSGILPPNEKYKLVDHVDGDEWNCKRGNLVWATHLTNRLTSNGRNRIKMK